VITDPGRTQGVFGDLYLPGGGMRVSRLCMGTMTFAAQTARADALRMLDMALDRGIFFFDTANAYSSGDAERILGEWCKSKRDRVVIASKIRYQVGGNPMSVGLSRRAVLQQVEACLKRLQTDYLDILYLHQPDDHTELAITLRAVDDLLRQGKVVALGMSNYAAWQIMAATCAAEKAHWQPPLIVQAMYNLLARGIDAELLPCCRSLSLPVYAYNPLAAGLLTGKHDYARQPAPAGRFNVFPYYQQRYWHQPMFQAVEHLAGIAGQAGMTLLEMAFAWILQQPGITGLLLGASSPKQLQENFDALGKTLDKQTLAACDEAYRALAGPIPAYNR